MDDRIISYLEMCQTENMSLQQGMNYGFGKDYSIILMSVRQNAPYRDEIQEEGTVLIYEGHDAPKSPDTPNVKSVDQPKLTRAGSLTQNGKFYKAAQDFKNGLRTPEKVRVYEKIKNGIWSQNGFFELVDAWIESDGARNVFKFRLRASQEQFQTHGKRFISDGAPSRRIIPTAVKLEVWKRDGGKCTQCGATDELHFDHIIPYSKGGTSLSANNIQLLCARHNLAKHDNIE